MSETDTATAATDVPEDDTVAEPGANVVELERPSGTPNIMQAARYGFDPKQVEAIRRTVAKDCTDADLVVFLEVCARTQLDPFQKQIFAAKIKGAMQIIVSRDGLLANAHRHGDLERFTGDVVRAGDSFRVEFDGEQRKITHSYGLDTAGFNQPRMMVTGEKPEPEPEPEPVKIDVDSWRGPIVGAWCVAKRADHDATYFFAPMTEYSRADKDTPWRSHPSAMILKCAEAYALRKAYTVSGVIGEEEGASIPVQNLTATPEIEWPDGEVGEEMRALYDQANELVGGSYRPQKMRQLLQGDHNALVDELRAFVDEHSIVEAEIVEAAQADPDAE